MLTNVNTWQSQVETNIIPFLISLIQFALLLLSQAY